MSVWASALRLARQWQLRSGQERLRGCDVGVDLLSLLRGHDHGGARVAALELLLELRRAAPLLRLQVLVSPALEGEVPAALADDLRVVPEAGPERERTLAAARGAGLLLSPLGEPSGAFVGPPVVALVTRLGHLRHPDRLIDFERQSRAEELRRWLPGCALLLCAHRADARLLAALERGWPAVRTVPLAPEARFPLDPRRDAEELAGLGLQPGFLFYPANYWPHKNHALLLAAYAMLEARGGSLPPLVCAGGADGPRCELQLVARRLGLADRVVCLPAVSDAGLAGLYRGCRAVVLPWLHGGLAWPVREAARFGRPVFCSRFTLVPAGFPAQLFDPRRLEALADALSRAARAEPRPERQPEPAGAAGTAMVGALAWAWRRSVRRVAA